MFYWLVDLLILLGFPLMLYLQGKQASRRHTGQCDSSGIQQQAATTRQVALRARVAAVENAIRHGRQGCIESLASVHMARLVRRCWRIQMDGHAAAGLGSGRRIGLQEERGSGERLALTTKTGLAGWLAPVVIIANVVALLPVDSQRCDTGHMRWKLALSSSLMFMFWPRCRMRRFSTSTPQHISTP